MPPRVKKNHRVEPEVYLGGVDPLSNMAKQAGLPMCSNGKEGLRCTRSAGHDEDPGSKHVHVRKGIVQIVWEATS